MIKKFYPILILFLFAGTASIAQTIDVNFNGLGFLDNREYKDFIDRSHTYSGTRLALDFGLNLDSLNHFIVGVNAIHEFGAKPFFLNVDPVAYYSYTGKNWLFDAGEFPREGLISDYPRALLNDTLMYYRPNIQGLLARVKNDHFTETGWIDWVSRQTNTDREQFLFGFSGKYKPSITGIFYVSHYFLLEHNAGAAIPVPDDHIMDSGGGELKLGLDFTHKQNVLDSLSVEAGGLISLERTRGVDALQTPKGFVANVYLSYKRFAIFDEYYNGKGSHIDYGDSFYEKKFYNRLDLMYTPFSAKGIKGQFILSIHRTPGYTSNQEAFRITYDLGRRVIARFKDQQ
jgi:hypothetical protein